MLKKILRFFLYLFISSLVYVLITKFIEPPITVTQITNAFGLGLKRDYVAWDKMSYNIKLAAMASEDQAFTDHMGFDWDAIEKSLRPKKKKKKSKEVQKNSSSIQVQTDEGFIKSYEQLQRKYSDMENKLIQSEREVMHWKERFHSYKNDTDALISDMKQVGFKGTVKEIQAKNASLDILVRDHEKQTNRISESYKSRIIVARQNHKIKLNEL